MTLPLCGSCHENVHSNSDLDLKLKQRAEKIWIEEYAKDLESEDDKINLFIRRYGKNYLW